MAIRGSTAVPLPPKASNKWNVGWSGVRLERVESGASGNLCPRTHRPLYTPVRFEANVEIRRLWMQISRLQNGFQREWINPINTSAIALFQSGQHPSVDHSAKSILRIYPRGSARTLSCAEIRADVSTDAFFSMHKGQPVSAQIQKRAISKSRCKKPANNLGVGAGHPGFDTPNRHRCIHCYALGRGTKQWNGEKKIIDLSVCSLISSSKRLNHIVRCRGSGRSYNCQNVTVYRLQTFPGLAEFRLQTTNCRCGLVATSAWILLATW